MKEGQSSKAVRLRFVALLVRSWLQLVGSDAVRLQRVRFEPVRWLRIAYPAGEPLPGWLPVKSAVVLSQRVTPLRRSARVPRGCP